MCGSVEHLKANCPNKGGSSNPGNISTVWLTSLLTSDMVLTTIDGSSADSDGTQLLNTTAVAKVKKPKIVKF